MSCLTVPWIVKYAIDALDEDLPPSKLAQYAWIIVGLTAFQGVFRFLMRRILIGTSRRIEYDLRNDFFRHIERLSFKFYNRTSTGDLMARATNDLNSVRDLLGPALMYSASTIVAISVSIYWMARIDRHGRGALHVVVNIRVPKRLSRRGRKLLEELDRELEPDSSRRATG